LGITDSITPKSIKEKFLNLFIPISGFLSKRRVSPNIITFLGTLISFFAGFLFYLGQTLLAGLSVILSGFMDIIDGQVAKLSGKETRFGGVLDSSLDRYSEIFIYLGISLLFFRKGDELTSFMTILALIGSMLVSYVKARAEGAGIPLKSGFFQRAERFFFISSGGILGVEILKVFMYIIALVSHITAIQRIVIAKIYVKED
jgi:phosphatidylglycerophosphate synthase